MDIVHELPGRIRLRGKRPFTSKEAEIIKTDLSALPAVTEARVSRRTASILIKYNEPAAKHLILEKLDQILKDLHSNKKLRARRPRPQVKLRIGGILRYVFLRPFLPLPAQAAMAVFTGLPFLQKGLKALARRRIDEDILDASAIGVSLFRRDFGTAGLLALLLGVGDMLADWSRKKSMASLEHYLAFDVDKIWVEREESEISIPVSELRNGDLVIARTGSVLPVDGLVISGEGMVNQSSMTGEPLSVYRNAGKSVFAGTVLEEGELRIRPTKVGGETRLRQIASFIEDSESHKAGAQSGAEHMAKAFVPFTFLLAGMVLLITRDFTRATSVLLVDYSCALRLSTPLAVLTAMREGVGNGVLVKGGRFLEILPEVDTIVFDKTGTLTIAQPEVAAVVPAQGYERSQILRLAACLEEHFPHPVARAIVRQAEREKLNHHEEHAEVHYIVAHGVVSQLNGKRICIGSERFINQDEGVSLDNMADVINDLAARGLSLLYLAMDGALIGVIAIQDPIRPEAQQVIKDLRAAGARRIVMLTGDSERTAASVASKLGITEWRAHILPVDKAKVIADLKKQAHKVMMVGDGLNDAPALSSADISATLRDGSDLAREVADIVLNNGNLSGLLVARNLGTCFLKRIHLNFLLIMSLNSIFLGAGLIGRLAPSLAAILHNTTTVGVALNAMRRKMPQTSRLNRLRKL